MFTNTEPRYCTLSDLSSVSTRWSAYVWRTITLNLVLLSVSLAFCFCCPQVYNQNFTRGSGGEPLCTPSSYKQFLPLPIQYFKVFMEGFLNDPHHSTLSIFHCYAPTPITTPVPPPTNFDCTPEGRFIPQFHLVF